MAYQIRPISEFLVRPALPPGLSRLNELAHNIFWSWEPIIRTVFRRLDPILWKESGYNPVAMLARLSQTALDRAAADNRFMALYADACERLDVHMGRQRAAVDGKLVAYFSAEYGLSECLPIYSGGLGILSGDHLKSASDLNLPLVAIGLLYQNGYFRQYLNPDGWQQERYLENDFYNLPIRELTKADGSDLTVQANLPTGPLHIKVWGLDVGKTLLLLLDTNIPQNVGPDEREITSQLYGGDSETRIRQEIVLGIGGMRALQALDMHPTVFHMNEGHSAFLGLERIRGFMKSRGLSFDAAVEASRANNVFTTHTPVPAGIDLFDGGMMYRYFNDYCREAGIGTEQFLALGRRNPGDQSEPFSMAILALKTSCYRNAVSRLHRTVSQHMWNDLWPQLPYWETPIGSVTNGVHLPSWINGDLADLYDQYLEPGWREGWDQPDIWKRVDEIPDEELKEVHRRRKRRLIAFIRARQTESAFRRKVAAAEQRYSSEVLDPNALTIGFARRFATYKRATLLFRDADRLMKILTNKEQPVQVIIAGKAHPKDAPGKTFIREIVQMSRDSELWKHVVFVEDYDMKVGRELVQGVDVWLNTPRRGEEACGTSGMKAALNGVLNLSILDGWFDECYEVSGGWAIGDTEPYSEEQDALHASAIYYLLENEIVPMYYDRRERGTSSPWMRRVKMSLMNISQEFDARRMVAEYDSELYVPAHRGHCAMMGSGYQKATQLAEWSARVREVWNGVKFVEATVGTGEPLTSNQRIPVRAVLDLAGLAPSAVRVEAVIGRVGVNGNLEETEVVYLPSTGTKGNASVFSTEIKPQYTGRLGFSVRVSPNHSDDPMTRQCATPIKWT